MVWVFGIYLHGAPMVPPWCLIVLNGVLMTCSWCVHGAYTHATWWLHGLTMASCKTTMVSKNKCALKYGTLSDFVHPSKATWYS